MPSSVNDSYAGSCNPSRRAKQSRVIDIAPAVKPATTPPSPTSATPQQRTILPLPTSNMNKDSNDNPVHHHTDDDETPSAPIPAQQQRPPSKRGRKPGPLSRSAREAQRKLNHSIIEKARRTKINDALATLRQLVPADYGYPKSNNSNSEDADDDGEDADEAQCDKDSSKKDKPKGTTSKKEEKEKEFKLEILVRTVSYMQELLDRVKTLEKRAANGRVERCPKCGQQQQQHAHEASKRKKTVVEVSDDAEDDGERSSMRRKRSRGESFGDDDDATSRRPSLSSHRLPSISAWLPSTTSSSSPLSFSPTQRRNAAPSDPIPSHLPSPPSSAHFDPIPASQIPPVLSLGPVASHSNINQISAGKRPRGSSNSSIGSGSGSRGSNNPSPPLSSSYLLSPQRTPDDESAASMLLRISSSSSSVGASAGSGGSGALPPPANIPQQHNPPGGSLLSGTEGGTTSFYLSRMRTSCVTPVEPLHHHENHRNLLPQAQTPGSLLGLTLTRNGA